MNNVAELIVILVMLVVLALCMTQTNEYKTGKDALMMIKECEKELPRNQKCIIVAKHLTNIRTR